LRGFWECRAAQISAKAYVDVAALELINVELRQPSSRNGENPPAARDDGKRRHHSKPATRHRPIRQSGNHNQTDRQPPRFIKRPLLGKDKIALAVGAVINRYKMAKHFDITIQRC
jgi:hypothetical protein